MARQEESLRDVPKERSAQGLVDRKLLFWVNIEFITFQVWLLVMTNASHIYAYQGVSLSLYPKTKYQPELRFILILRLTFISFFLQKILALLEVDTTWSFVKRTPVQMAIG